MYVTIHDAPFTQDEKKQLLKMGMVGGDWGHPAVTLPNPVEWFKTTYNKKADRNWLTQPEQDKAETPLSTV